MKKIKIITTAIYAVYSAVSVMLFLGGLLGVPTFVESLIGLFFAKLLGIAVGVVSGVVWFRATEWLSERGYIYQIF